MFQSLLYSVFSLKKGELRLLFLSLGFIFFIFSSYALLRPLRDALGLHGGQSELKYLFIGTFIASLLASIVAIKMSSKLSKSFYINAVFIFFILNLALFGALVLLVSPESGYFLYLSRGFYIWVSVFNLFIISTAWSLFADLFDEDKSKRFLV